MRPVPLLPQLLAELAATRRVLVVAAVARAAVAARLAGLGLGGVAEAVGPEEAPAAAGERAALLAAALKGSAPGGDAGHGQPPPWFVVDTVADARLAAAVGARPLGVAWGRQGPGRLRAAGVEEVVDTPLALVRTVDPEVAGDVLGLGHGGVTAPET